MSPLGTFATPDARFAHVHLDMYRWPEVVHSTDTTAENDVRAYLLNRFVKYTSPKRVTADRGVQFETLLFQSTMQFLCCE